MSQLTLLIDGDMFCYKAAVTNEKTFDWEDSITVVAEKLNATNCIEYQLKTLQKQFNCDKIIITFSDVLNWRHLVYPEYKRHRRKCNSPLLLNFLQQYLESRYVCYTKATLEGDDVLGILATHPTLIKGKKIIVAEDKDLLQIPGTLYNPIKKTLIEISEEEADYYHLYQSLIGDVTDGYPGCKGIGEKQAKKILDSQGVNWNSVIKAYKDKGFTEEFALSQARVARICRYSDYDGKIGQVRLWNPSH